jgi:hypothetical protein
VKKIFALILSIVYLTSSVGATVHLHYCMDKLVNWSLKDEGDECKNCGMEKDGNCCKDEQKFVKNNLDQSITGAIQLLQSPATDTHFSFISFVDDHSYPIINEHPISHSPPTDDDIDILIHNCVFRI